MPILEIKSKLNELMESRSVTQADLAKETGLAPSTLARLAKDRFDRVDVQTMIKLCNYFNLDSVGDLFVTVNDASDCPLPENIQSSSPAVKAVDMQETAATVDDETDYSGNSYDDEEYSNLVLLNGVRWGDTFYVRVLHPVAKEKFGEFYSFDSEQNRQKAIAAGEAEAATYEDVYSWMLEQQQEN